MEISFGGQKDPANQSSQKKYNPADELKQALEEIGTLGRRIRLIENSINNMRSTSQNIEKNFVDFSKESRRDTRTLEEENTELKEDIRLIKSTLKKVIEDMQNTARSTDVKVIQKYLDYWNPVKFSTIEMTKKIAKDVYDEQKNITEKIEKIKQQKQNL